jgi:hypothetical protein
MSRASGGHSALGNGTPEQVHLTWGDDPATSVVVSWASPGRALRPRVRIGQRVIPAREQAYRDQATGKTAWTYHARVTGLRPGASYAYAVTADNDANSGDPFTSTFRTAPTGRAAFRFTSSGDLAMPDSARAVACAGHAAGAVESFQPLFHLMNAGLCGTAPGVWRDFGNASQLSAASRPWMPVPGNSDAGDAPGLTPYRGRYELPADGAPDSGGRWYSFRVASVVVACLDTSDVSRRDVPDGGASLGKASAPDPQTAWLEQTLARARADASVDWIIVQAHHPACSSWAPGSYLGVRSQWLPLFDRYQVDLVLAGHATGYERSYPCRGTDQPQTRRPHAVTRSDASDIDTSLGTVHLTLGRENLAGHYTIIPGPDTADRDDTVPHDTVPHDTVPHDTVPGIAWVVGGFRRAGTEGSGPWTEHATWSARRDAPGGYGIAVFDVDPGGQDGEFASIAVTTYRAADPAMGDAPPCEAIALVDDLTAIERFTLVRPRFGGQGSRAESRIRGSAADSISMARMPSASFSVSFSTR